MAEHYVVFDFETTGFSPVKNEIIQIGAVKFDAETNEEVGRFNELVKPERSYISSNITNLTGIKPADVLNAPLIAELLPDFLTFLDDSLLVAHNASFDMSFLKQAAEDCELDLPNFELYDTLSEAKRLIKGRKSYKLEEFKGMLGVKLRSHDALNDCLITAKLYQHLQTLEEEVPAPIEKKPRQVKKEEQLDLFADFDNEVEEVKSNKKVIYTRFGLRTTRQGSPDGISEEVRRELGLPITKDLVYYREVERKSWAVLKVLDLNVEREYSAGASLTILLENEEEVLIHSDFLKEMQKVNFIEEMKKDK